MCIVFHISNSVTIRCNTSNIILWFCDHWLISAHIFFDDAFEAHEDDENEFHVNNFVKSLVNVISTAARLVFSSLFIYYIPTVKSNKCASYKFE